MGGITPQNEVPVFRRLNKASRHTFCPISQFFFETVLSTVSLVDHHNNVFAFGKRGFAFFKFLHCGENDAVGAAT